MLDLFSDPTMNSTSANSTWALPHWMRPWEQFWFTPADPTLLALMRVTCGVLIAYTLFVYGFTLQDFMGEYAVHDMILRMGTVREKPVMAPRLFGDYQRAPTPKDDFQRKYYDLYQKTWGAPPPAPYPSNEDDVAYLDRFQTAYGIDLRYSGLPIPTTEMQKSILEAYAERWHVPPPAYPKDEVEALAIDEYMTRYSGVDPRRLYAKGSPEWSLWFHVVDPKAMMIIHSLFVLASVLFTFGFCTRITAAITWLANLTYILRNPTILFGADTMFTILMLYLMIGPSGEVFSLDRVIRRWWSKAKPGFVQGWYRLWGKPVPAVETIAPVAFSETPQPSISANVAIRLLQIHVCIIYLMSGLSKLLGPAWWNGTAIWGTVANFELAPMNYSLYLDFLRFLGNYPLANWIFLTGGGLFTLTIEISNVFLVWRPSLRWLYLSAALLLHMFIGVLMGLSTFALIMVVMNMAFLRKAEVVWLLSWIGMKATTAVAAPNRPEPALTAIKV